MVFQCIALVSSANWIGVWQWLTFFFWHSTFSFNSKGCLLYIFLQKFDPHCYGVYWHPVNDLQGSRACSNLCKPLFYFINFCHLLNICYLITLLAISSHLFGDICSSFLLSVHVLCYLLTIYISTRCTHKNTHNFGSAVKTSPPLLLLQYKLHYPSTGPFNLPYSWDLR